MTTERVDGDFAPDGDDALLLSRRRAASPLPWVWLRQVHGCRVVVADDAGVAGREADAAVTARDDLVLAVQTADCAPVALWGPGTVGIAHAGWRGLVAGVLEATVAGMDALGGAPTGAVVGPCISPAAYQFGEPELSQAVERYGGSVVGRTHDDQPALDVRVMVATALSALGVGVVGTEPDGSIACTASDPDRFFSYRARREAGRQATAVWRAA